MIFVQGLYTSLDDTGTQSSFVEDHRFATLKRAFLDGKYTVIEVECLGACGFATPIMINHDFIESVTPEKVPQLLASLK